MNKILEAFGEYIDSIIEQKLANRPQHGLDPATLTKLIDERIAAALIDPTQHIDKDAVRERIVDGLKAHFDKVGIDMSELSEEVATYLLRNDSVKPGIERAVKNEMREIVRDEIGDAVDQHLKDNQSDLEEAVSTYFDNEVDSASDIVRKALRGFTVLLTDPRETY